MRWCFFKIIINQPILWQSKTIINWHGIWHGNVYHVSYVVVTTSVVPTHFECSLIMGQLTMTWFQIWPSNFFLHFEVESKPKQNWAQKISKFSPTKQNFNLSRQFQSNKLTSDQTRFYTRPDFSKYVTCRLMFQPNTNINKIYIIIINREHS
jgi:hypothetical protein